MERLTEWIDEDKAVPRMDMKRNGHQRCVNKLAELEDMEEQGKLMILPCKPGDTVYYIYMDCPEDYKEEYCKDHEGGCEKCHHRTGKILSKRYTIHDIGLPVYLTEWQAKEALEGMENEYR